MNKKLLTTIFATMLPAFVSAHTLEVGKALPTTSVTDAGELVIQNDNIAYQDWSTSQLTGKVRVIQAIAGRSSAKKLNADMMSAITAAQFPEDKYQTTTIINQDDAIWGTGGFVKSSAEDSKKEFFWSSMVLDANGQVHSAWQLEAESSAIIALDPQGKVLFVKEGKLSSSEIEQVIGLIKQAL